MAISLPEASDVIALTGTKLPEPVVEAIINDAALMAYDCLADQSEEMQIAVVKWLAAHLVSMAGGGSSGMLTSRRLGDASKTYAVSASGDGLKGTVYGRQVIALLPCLSTLGQSTVSIEVI